MYKPDRKIKKILAEYNTCAYIYNDGMCISESKRIKLKGMCFTKHIYHVFYNIKIHVSMRKHLAWCESEHVDFIGRIIIHNASILIDGIKNSVIDVSIGVSSEHGYDHGIRYDSISFESYSGMYLHEESEIRHNGETVVSGRVTIQNDYERSIEELRYEEMVIEYGK